MERLGKQDTNVDWFLVCCLQRWGGAWLLHKALMTMAMEALTNQHEVLTNQHKET